MPPNPNNSALNLIETMNHVIYLIDLHLCFPQLPLVALHITFQLQVVVLKAAD